MAAGAHGTVSGDMAMELQTALLNMVGKPVKQFVAVDLGEELAKLGLASLVPIEACFPCSRGAAAMSTADARVRSGLASSQCRQGASD